MSINQEKKEVKEDSKKYLYIKLHKPMPEIVDEYMNESGVDKHDMGFHMGFIAGHGDEDLMYPLAALNQMFFYAGIYYAKKYPGKFDYSMTNKKPITPADKVKDKIKSLKEAPSYLG